MQTVIFVKQMAFKTLQYFVI